MSILTKATRVALDPGVLGTRAPVSRAGVPTPAVPSVSSRLPQPRPGRLATKLFVDRVVAGLLMIPALPVIGLAAAAVKLTSPGPVFYTQVRSGMNGKPFRMIKVRSMRHNCEAATGAVWASRIDDRVTLVGSVLRDTHLDELPQLFNILRGEMSLIGPRPERPEIAEKLQRQLPAYRGRLAVRPGLTGLAQVELPADSDIPDVQHKLMYDLYYVRHVGQRLDARIFVATALHIAGLALTTVGRLFVRSCRRSVLTHGLSHSPATQTPWTGVRGNGAGETVPPQELDLPPAAAVRALPRESLRPPRKIESALPAPSSTQTVSV